MNRLHIERQSTALSLQTLKSVKQKLSSALGMSGTTQASIKLAYIHNSRLTSKLCPYGVSSDCSKLCTEKLGKYWTRGELNTAINFMSDMKRLTAK